MDSQFSIDCLATPAFGWPARRAQFAMNPQGMLDIPAQPTMRRRIAKMPSQIRNHTNSGIAGGGGLTRMLQKHGNPRAIKGRRSTLRKQSGSISPPLAPSGQYRNRRV